MRLDSTTFPSRLACFGQGGFINETCTTPSQSMINFLNISDASTYLQVYCLNPPKDSCAFGYCPNPDIASPAVRISTYLSAICLSIIVLYGPEDMVSAFYGQLFQIYSLMIAAVTAISARELTRLHAVFALIAAASPLSIYLLMHAIRRSVSRAHTRLDSVFGHNVVWQARLNRAAVLLMFPFWLTVLVIILRQPTWFQQTACDDVNSERLTGRFFLGPLYLLMNESWSGRAILFAPFFALVIAWVVAISSMRAVIFKKDKGIQRIPLRMWRKTTKRFPFLLFCTVVLFPSASWITMLESGALFSKEYFQPTYGQLLAIFVAVPPAVQCILMYKRCYFWFMDLTWVRFISGRQHSPLYSDQASALGEKRSHDIHFSTASMSSLGSYATLYDPPSAASR
ncbi:hypothetical protein DFH11DRAFT_88715 [Phellopilus nigrolimitatus]|nr:hypothetical protein DFH11DRAFT_88715 [Phellopilus nigrolimitatus]